MTTTPARSPAPPTSGRDTGPPTRFRTEVRSFLELFVLTGFVVAQPLFDVAGRSPDFFLFRRADRADILLLVALVVLGPALLLWAAEALVGVAVPSLRRTAHLAVVAGLLLLLGVEVLKKLTPVRGVPLLLLALACGLAASLVYARSTVSRLWLRYATPAPLVFVLLFVTVSPVGRLVLPGGDAGRARVAVPAEARAPVVMLFFDEFPMMSLLDSRGRIDRRLFPNLAGFAGDATWYRNATGIGPFTPYAVPAMLTGRYPTRRGVAPSYTEYPDNLFTMLAGSYNVRAFETVTQLCPPRVCTATTGDRGGTAEHVAVGADFGIQDSLDILMQKIQTAIDEGFPRIKLKFRPGWDLDMVSAVRSTFPDFTFHIDCNAAYTIADDVGRIVEIRGVVLDAVFHEELPAIYNALRIQVPEQDGRSAVDLIAEVQQHLGNDRVRAVAMDSTDGIARGTEAEDTGVPITVPVGEVTLGRIFNVLGDPIDEGDPVEAEERWPIHRESPAFEELELLAHRHGKRKLQAAVRRRKPERQTGALIGAGRTLHAGLVLPIGRNVQTRPVGSGTRCHCDVTKGSDGIYLSRGKRYRGSRDDLRR